MKITACPRCGSKDIQMGTMDAGVTFGVTSWKSQCRECGYQGEPLIFESEEDYETFYQQMTAEKESETSAEPVQNESLVSEDDDVPLSEKEKEVVQFLQEIDKESTGKEDTTSEKVFPDEKSWWPELGISMIIAVVILFLFLSSLYSTADLMFTIVFGFVLFIVETMLILFAIIVIEYVIISVNNFFKRKNK